jgi:hypothetical protein
VGERLFDEKRLLQDCLLLEMLTYDNKKGRNAP